MPIPGQISMPIDTRDEASEEKVKQFFDENEVAVVILDSLGTEEIKDLVAAWEKRRGRQPINDALELLVKIIQKQPEERRLTAAIQIWKQACRAKEGATPSQKDVEEATRER